MICSLTDIPSSGICLVSLSANSDHQNTIYSMFSALDGEYVVHTVGAVGPLASNARYTPRNHYVECPERPGIAKGTFDLPGVMRIVEVIKSTKCRTIYFESVHIWNCVIMAFLGDEYTKVTTLHDVIPHDGSKSVLICQKLQSKLSDFVVVKSPCFYEEAKKLYSLSDDRLIVFGVWRDYPAYRYFQGDGSFLFFGRLRRYKGLNNLLEIAKKCPDAKFRVVGSPDEESAYFVELLSELPNVDVSAKYVSDDEMRDYFVDSSWVLLPYQDASQSGVIIDSYKYGRPVITFDVGAISNQVIHGRTGFLANADDLDGFCSLIKKAKDSMGRHAEFCKNSYEFGYENYSAEAKSDAFASLFNVEKKGKRL